MKTYFDSHIGWLLLTASENALESIRFLETEPDIYNNTKSKITKKTIAELTEYFNGDRTQFTLPLKPKGSDFQKSVWQQLRQIPYGHTLTYKELAEKLGDPNKVRAVGRANAQNPIPVIIPCHRVVGADNKLVGYGGGIARKRYLLKHEGVLLL
jgi:methylated-DNA-[protein]-cysteine S-methyltransferase